jgi:hypothetical protein
MATPPPCTLVTAAYVFSHAGARTAEETLRTMRTLLAVPCYLVVYCDPKMEPLIRGVRGGGAWDAITRVVVQPFEALWCAPLLDRVRANREIYWPTRDARTSAETHLITCNKADFVLQAMALNPFGTSIFGWIDANIGEGGSKISWEYENHLLLSILSRVDERFHLQIMNVTDKRFKIKEHKRECYAAYRWIACGCLFTTGVEVGRRVLGRVKELVLEATEMGFGHGEEMFYLEIIDEFYDEIHRGYGDYRDLLHNFIEPTTNLVYVYWHVVMRSYEMGYDRECMDAAVTLLRRFDAFGTEMNYDLYMRLLMVYYLAAGRRSMPEQQAWAAEKIREGCRVNPYLREQFWNLRGLCGMPAEFTP